MKNSIFNFRNTSFLPIVLFAALLMTACQKENLQELTTATKHQSIDQPSLENSIHIKVKEAFRKNRQTATARSATYLILDTVITIEEYERATLAFAYDEIPDPTVWKIEARMIPIHADPGMALIAFDEGEVGDGGFQVASSRLIRRNPEPGSTEEVLTFRQSDLLGYEDFVLVDIMAVDTAVELRLVISGATVDCEEYVPAEQTVTANYAPVCGCNGETYNNKSEAFANGITSWNLGVCPPQLDTLVIIGEWVLEDAKLKYFDLDIHKIIIDDLAAKIRILTPCSLYDCDWDWENLVKNPKTKKYEAIYKFKTEKRYFQIELVKEGLLKVELYRDFPGKIKNTKTVYHFTRK